MERQSGVPRAVRAATEAIECEAEQAARRAGLVPPFPSTPRFNPALVADSYLACSSLAWWVCLFNVLGGLVYLASCGYGVGVSVAVSAAADSTHHTVAIPIHDRYGRHTGDAASMLMMTQVPQLERWIRRQRMLNLIGDAFYLLCCITCEIDWLLSRRREAEVDDAAAAAAASAAAPLSGALLSPSVCSLGSSSAAAFDAAHLLADDRFPFRSPHTLTAHLMSRPGQHQRVFSLSASQPSPSYVDAAACSGGASDTSDTEGGDTDASEEQPMQLMLSPCTDASLMLHHTGRRP